MTAAPNNRWRPGPRPIAAAALIGLVAAAPGCKNRRTADPGDRDRPTATDASLATLTREGTAPTIQNPPDDGFETTRRRVQESAALLETLMANMDANPGFGGDPGGTAGATPAIAWQPEGRSGEQFARDPDPKADPKAQPPTRFSLSAFTSEEDARTDIADPPAEGSGELEPGPIAVADATPAAAPDSGEAAPTGTDPNIRKQALIDELIAVLGELARSGDAPASSALALAGLEAVRPQALDAFAKEGLLSPAELASLDAARELFRAMASEGALAGPAEVSAVLDRIQRDLDARAGLRIIRAELCTRVTGFGRYEPFPANRFIAGRAQPVIVYTEVERFAHRELSGTDGQPRFEIELSQRLELYHTADNLNTWNRAAETDKTVSRNRVRDYYLINQVTLPPNLSIGKYHLKVVMRDLVGDHLAETIIPIEIVAATSAGAR